MLDHPAKPIFAFARVHRAMNLAYLRTQEAHATRTVPTAEPRRPAGPAGCLFWSAFGSANGEIIDDYQRMRSRLQARERKGAALCLHMLIGVSPDWVGRMGDVHDPENPRVQDLFRAALDFSREHFNGVFHARMDLDERGGAVVDIFATHAHERQARRRKKGDRGTPVVELSVKTALEAMSAASGAAKSFTAVQTLWAAFARERLDLQIVRGVAKEVTGRRHLGVQEYRQQIAREKEQTAHRSGMLATMATTVAVFLASEKEQGRRTTEQDQRGSTQDRREGEQDAREDKLEQRELALEAREAQAAEREREYLDWAAQKDVYESELDVRWLQVATVQADAEERIDRERQLLEASRLGFHETMSAREAELCEREDVLIEREVASARQGAEVAARSSALAIEKCAVDEAVEAAEERTKQAVALEAEAVTVQGQLRAGLSMIADARLIPEDLDAWAAAAAVRPLLIHAFNAVDARTALERQVLHKQRERQGRQDRALADRAVLVTQREQLADERQSGLDTRDARSVAYQRGLALVASGVIRTPTDIETDALLAPAHDLIGEVLASTSAARSALERREQQLVEVKAEVDAKRANLRVVAVAREAGLRAIESGQIGSANQIMARTDLAPAAQDLVRTLSAIVKAVELLGQRAATQIALAGEARSRLADEREEAQSAHHRATQAVKDAEQAEAAAMKRDAAATTALQHVGRLLSSVAAFVDVVAARTDLPAAILPAVRKVIDAQRALGEAGRGRWVGPKGPGR